VFMGILCWFTAAPAVATARARGAISSLAVAAIMALLTPPLWTTWRPRFLPWYLESYVNGVHTFGVPQPWLFPIFPWTGLAFAGLAVGFLLFANWSTQNPGFATALCGAVGVALFYLSSWLDARPERLYAVYDYWHTSPNFFLARVGILMVILWAVYAWCRWGLGQIGFSPLIQLGQASLLIYWVHIEFVYGRFSILPKQSETIPAASVGLLIIFSAMTLLATLRTRFKGRGGDILARLRRGPRAAENS